MGRKEKKGRHRGGSSEGWGEGRKRKGDIEEEAARWGQSGVIQGGRSRHLFDHLTRTDLHASLPFPAQPVNCRHGREMIYATATVRMVKS